MLTLELDVMINTYRILMDYRDCTTVAKSFCCDKISDS